MIKEYEDTVIKHFNNQKAFNECLNSMNNIYEDIDEYNPTRKIKTFIVFDDMIEDIMSNKKCHTIVKKLFNRDRKVNISLVFIIQSYFSIPKQVRLYTTYFLIMKINNKRELKNTTTTHFADIDYKVFVKIIENAQKTRNPFLLLIQHYQLVIL